MNGTQSRKEKENTMKIVCETISHVEFNNQAGLVVVIYVCEATSDNAINASSSEYWKF